MSILKIGIVCYPSIGGSGVVATNLGNELAALGHEVHFISYEKPFRLSKSPRVYFHKVNINKYSLFKYPDYTLPLAVAIGNVHEEFELDIIHVHYAVPHATAALLAVQMIEQCSHCKPPKIITTLHGTDITLIAQDPALGEVIKYSIEKSDGVTAVSNSLKNDTLKILQTTKQIEVIYNFYTPARVTHSRELVRKGLRIKDDDILGVHLSNLRPVKRIPDLLKTLSFIRNPNFKLLILAGSKFEPYLPLVKKLKLKNKLIVKENVRDIESYINAADLGLFTSEEESFGMGILECMAFGLPVVSTKVGGTGEVIGNEKVGFLTKMGDIKTLAAKTELLIKNTELRLEMGHHAKQRAEKLFSTNNIVNQYIELYKKTI